MKQKRNRLGRKLLSFLLMLAMVMGLVPGMSLKAQAEGTTYSPASKYKDYGTLNSNDTTVKIEGVKIGDTIVDWYVIDYNSTDQTVTLLSKQSFEKIQFNSDDNLGNVYASSKIKKYVEGLTGENQPLAGIKDALADISGKVTGEPDSISGAVPYLLSYAEANALSTTKKLGDGWWLRSRSPGNEFNAAYAFNGYAYEDGYYVGHYNDVRPALKLNLSSVTFSSESNTFTVGSAAATVDVTDINLNKTSVNLNVNGTQTLTATVSPDDATDNTVTWLSSDTSVATVDDSGKVTAVAAGNATITATATNGTNDTGDDKTATCTVTVTAGGSGTGGGTTPSPSTGSTTGDSSSTGDTSSSTEQEVTLPVSSDEDTKAVPVNVRGDGNASIKEAGAAALQEVLDSKNPSGDVVIDASGIGQKISSVTLPSDIMGKIVDAANDDSHDAKTMTIKMSEGSLSFDGSALEAILSQAGSADEQAGSDPAIELEFHIERVIAEKLSAEQQKTVKNMGAEKILDVYIASNGKLISDFKGGRAVVEALHEIRKGMEKAYHVWYVAENGQKTYQARQVLEKSIRFVTGHMSNYVIEYDPENLKDNDDFSLVPQTTVKKFADVEEGSWYEEAVAWAVENDITNGTSDTTFSPKKDCSRGEMITFVWRMSSSPDADVSSIPFKDVPGNELFAAPVAWAYGKKVTAGTTETTFSPMRNCTRAEFVTFLWRLAGSPDTAKGAAFNDVDANSYYAKAVAWAADKGITSGVSKTSFAPDDSCTRAEAVTFLHRYGADK